MSVVNIAGEEVQLPQDPEAFRHRLENQWAKQDPYRWKQLAILTLLGNGWQVPNIARALKLNKGHVYRIVNQARARVGQFAQAESSEPEECNVNATTPAPSV